MSFTSPNPVHIYIASHLPIQISENERVSIVQAGSADPGFFCQLKDSDSKDNISHLNPVYSELTVQYMILASDKSALAEKIGFMHYRRFLVFANPLRALLLRLFVRFSFSRQGYRQIVKNCLDPKRLDEQTRNADLIIPKPINLRSLGFQSVKDHYIHHHFESDWEVCSQKVKEICPALYQEFLDLSTESNLYTGNIYSMSKGLFLEYGSLLFKILEQVRSEIDLDIRNTQEARALGYLAERIFTAFVNLKRKEGKIRIREFPLILINPPNHPKSKVH